MFCTLTDKTCILYFHFFGQTLSKRPTNTGVCSVFPANQPTLLVFAVFLSG